MALTETQKQAIRQFKATRAAIAKRARFNRAHPTGKHEWVDINGQPIPKPVEARGGGAPDPAPTGPKVQHVEPTGGKWIRYGPNGCSRFYPDKPYARPAEQERTVTTPAIVNKDSNRPWRMTASGPVQD